MRRRRLKRSPRVDHGHFAVAILAQLVVFESLALDRGVEIEGADALSPRPRDGKEGWRPVIAGAARSLDADRELTD